MTAPPLWGWVVLDREVMQRRAASVLLIVLAATAGCLAPLEHAYYDAKFSESHEAVVGAIRTMDADLDAYRAGDVTLEELEQAETETRATVAAAMDPLRDPWPPRWQESVSALEEAGATYLRVLDELSSCVESESMGSCDGVVDGLLEVFASLATAQQERPAPA